MLAIGAILHPIIAPAAADIPSSGSCAEMVEPFGSPLELSPVVRTTLLNWLDCEECTGPSLKAVKELGPSVVPYLACTLYTGAPSGKLVPLARFLKQRYGELLQYKATHSDAVVSLSESAYIATHLSHLQIQYQLRAATALGAIGSPSARLALKKALDPALHLDLSEVVRITIQETLQTMPH